MNAYETASAFNFLFRPGDILLVQDAFGGKFMDTLTRPARVMGDEPYIELQSHRYMVNVSNVVGKFENDTSSGLRT